MLVTVQHLPHCVVHEARHRTVHLRRPTGKHDVVADSQRTHSILWARSAARAMFSLHTEITFNLAQRRTTRKGLG